VQLYAVNSVAFPDNIVVPRVTRKASDRKYNQLASLLLGMPAGSVPAESVFSVTELICNSRRSRLFPDKLRNIMLSACQH